MRKWLCKYYTKSFQVVEVEVYANNIIAAQEQIKYRPEFKSFAGNPQERR